MTTRTADSKGRVTLGRRFANRTVIIREKDPTEVVVTLASVIPAREAWLLKNPKAKALLEKGLKNAKARRFVKAPNLKDDAALADEIEG